MLSRARPSPALLAFALAAGLPACASEDPAKTPPPAGGCAAPDCSGLPYPRIASYRIETYLDPDAEEVLGNTDLAIIDAEVGALDPEALGRLRERNPALDLLAYVTSEEIWHAPDPEWMPLATERLARIPPAFWLVEPGSSLAEDVDATSTVLRVADPAAFSVMRPPSDFYPEDEPTFLLLGNEHVRLVDIQGDELTVERGYQSTPEAHPAGTAAAAHVVFFSGTWMLNVAATAPSDPEHGVWRDMLAEEAAGMVTAGPWTGAFLDVCFSDIGWLNDGLLDVDRDGVADDPAEASQQWELGMGQLVDTLRATLGPDAPIIANPGAQDCPHEALDGILLEGWPIGLPPDYQTFEAGMERYLRWTGRAGRRPLSVANAFSPKIGFGVIEPGDDEVARTDYPAMRFGLGVALLGDGYYAFDNGVFGHYVAWWYDEYDGVGLGRGWLGYPLGPPTELEGGALAREFEHGYAVVNPTEAPVTVTVPPGLRRLQGTQDSAHNDGSAVTGPLEIAPKDAFLLVRDGG